MQSVLQHPKDQRVVNRFFPSSSLQADVVDPKAAIEKACHPSCNKYFVEYEKCTERIAKKGEGSCEPWAFDYWKCIDKCVSRENNPMSSRQDMRGLLAQAAPKIFALLK